MRIDETKYGCWTTELNVKPQRRATNAVNVASI